MTTRSRSLALGRLDGKGDLVVLSPSDQGVILEALRLAAETALESGLSDAGLRRIHDRIASVSGAMPMARLP